MESNRRQKLSATCVQNLPFSFVNFLFSQQEARRWFVFENLWASFQTVPKDQVWRNDSGQHMYAGIT